MSNLTTKLITSLLQGKPVDEFFRSELETAVNKLLTAELTAYLGYERYSSDGWGSGNSRNGFYERMLLLADYGEIHIKVPRDRLGKFMSKILPERKQYADDLASTVIQLYKNGVTTRQIASLIEQMYGHHYSPATISNITAVVSDQVAEFHQRKVSARYAVVYCDATYLNLRRDSVSKEALHVMLGITPDGKKEILDYALFPTEAAANYAEMLRGLKERGLEEVLLFVSDGLTGIRNSLLGVLPAAEHQTCWVHLMRSISRRVRKSDRKEVLEALKIVYQQATVEGAMEELSKFLAKYQKRYKNLHLVFEGNESLFTFYRFPQSIRKSIYTSNLIENCNKDLKHHTKLKEQFPNEDSLERFVCSYYCDYNRKRGDNTHRGFLEAEPELVEMFQVK